MAASTSPPDPTPPGPAASLREWTAYHLDAQAAACRILGSVLYGALLAGAASDVRRSGPVWSALEPHATRNPDVALALRFMAAVHRLVLTRRAGQLALFYPSVGGDAGLQGAWPAFRDAVEDHVDELHQLVGLPCQTNEVGRCAALAPGLLLAVRDSGLPVRLLEIGASAGLNLRWDLYRYADESGNRVWGDAESRVQLRGNWDVPAPLLQTKVTVSSRQGCDPRPVDPTTEEGRLGLTASVWADQPHRFERLRGALCIAADVAVEVEARGAGEWLPERLAESKAGVATAVYHSVVMQYMTQEERTGVIDVIHDAGNVATVGRPLYWLRMEPEQPLRAMAVRLTSWPGGEERLLATAGAHGDPVRWRDTTLDQ